jgi:hypothetical protein
MLSEFQHTSVPKHLSSSTTGQIELLGEALDEAVEPYIDGALLDTSSSTP